MPFFKPPECLDGFLTKVVTLCRRLYHITWSMDLLLDRSFQRSVPLKVPTLKSGKKSDPSPSCTDIGCEIMYRRFRGKFSFSNDRLSPKWNVWRIQSGKKGLQRVQNGSSDQIKTELMNDKSCDLNFLFGPRQTFWYWSPGLNTALWLRERDKS